MHYKFVFRIHIGMDARGLVILPIRAKGLDAFHPRLVHVKYRSSIIPILLCLLQTPWNPHNNIRSLYNNFSLGIAFPQFKSYPLDSTMERPFSSKVYFFYLLVAAGENMVLYSQKLKFSLSTPRRYTAIPRFSRVHVPRFCKLARLIQLWNYISRTPQCVVASTLFDNSNSSSNYTTWCASIWRIL
jgi:hypothetical protein